MTILTRESGGLWPHQRQAVETADRYLQAPDVAGASALITMPTGTGKTGVIATIATALPSVVGHRLVLTPWVALVRQMNTDLAGRFWERIAPELRPQMLPVRRLPPRSQLASLTAEEPTIYVATISAISVAAKYADAGAFDLADVFSEFGCVLVDEGHYEPAPEWSAAIRALKRPTILLTATPYRNDEKYFNVSDEWRFRFPHWQAEADRFLRKPDFVTLDAGPTPETFVTQLLETVSTRFADAHPRVIVRCETAANIRLVVRALQDAGESVIGVHDTFPAGEEILRNAVPLPENCAARFWVHQNKLIEGIDDPEFKVLAFYDSLKNDRAIVQQIGRVLRNPTRRRADMTALVIDRGGRDVERTWSAYRTFDRQDEAESVATLPDLVDRLLAAQPMAFYYDRAYRVRIDLASSTAWENFAFPLRTRVFRQLGDQPPTLDDIERETMLEWRMLDRTVYAAQEPDERTVILPFITASNSPLLRTGTFIELEFGYTVIRVDDDLLFLYDSRGNTPQAIADHYRPLRPPDLQVLFPQGSSSLTSVSLLNTDVGRQAARSRHVRAASIEDLAPDLSDFAYVCTIAEGYTEIADERFRRYLGLSNSRVNDFRPGERTFAAYSGWLEALKNQLAHNANGAATFTRYATYADEPTDKEPTHVLIDIDPTQFAQAGSGDPLELDDYAATVTNGEFSLNANGNQFPASLAWDDQKGRYELTAETLTAELFVSDDREPRELISAINADQRLRVVPAARTAVYAGGSFFRPIIPATRTGSFRLLDVLYPVQELAAATSEKGVTIVNADWDPASVFGIISSLSPSNNRIAPAPMLSALPTPDLVLCTDIGTEVADFVITGGGSVVFIHAKASPQTHHYGASSLHAVAAQAIKNLHHLQPLTDTPMSTRTWTGMWSGAPHVTGTTPRLRYGNFQSGPEMWKHIRRVVADPESDREVWLALGNSLSKTRLEAEATRRPPAPEAIQTFMLLQATWSAVSQLGARLRIFCSP